MNTYLFLGELGDRCDILSTKAIVTKGKEATVPDSGRGRWKWRWSHPSKRIMN